MKENGPVDWAHVVPGEDSDLARVHGGALEPAVLTAFQHQEHLALPQLQLVVFAGRVGEHGHVAGDTAQERKHEQNRVQKFPGIKEKERSAERRMASIYCCCCWQSQQLMNSNAMLFTKLWREGDVLLLP